MEMAVNPQQIVTFGELNRIPYYVHGRFPCPRFDNYGHWVSHWGGHDQYRSTEFDMVTMPPVGSPCVWTATVMTNIVQETMDHSSKYVQHCTIDIAMTLWHCTCTTAAYNIMHWVFYSSCGKIFNDIWTFRFTCSARLNSKMSIFLKSSDYSPGSFWYKLLFVQIVSLRIFWKATAAFPFD